MLIFILYSGIRDGEIGRAIRTEKKSEIGGLVYGEKNAVVSRSRLCLNRIPALLSFTVALIPPG